MIGSVEKIEISDQDSHLNLLSPIVELKEPALYTYENGRMLNGCLVSQGTTSPGKGGEKTHILSLVLGT